MAKTQDYTRAFNEAMRAFPFDMSAFQEAFKAQAALGEKMVRLGLDAMEQNAEIGGKWLRESIERSGEAIRFRQDPAEYGKALSEYASAQTELAAEKLSALAEVNRKAQMEALELMLTAGKDMAAEAGTAAKKAAGGAK